MILNTALRFVFILLPLLLTTELQAKGEGLSVEVQRIKKIQGQLHYQLFSCPDDEKTTWQQLSPLVTNQLNIDGDKLFLHFPAMKSGQYIIRMFQDLNNNAQLDFSGSGLPKEPTGFSNNPSLLLGYPTPSDSCFLYDKAQPASNLVTISLNNRRKKKRKRI